MAERERRLTRPFGGVFVARTQVMDADDLRRATWRMAHEIIEANGGVDDVVLIGLQTGGVPLAERLQEALLEIEGVEVPAGKLDVAFHRDDIGLRRAGGDHGSFACRRPDDRAGEPDEDDHCGEPDHADLDPLHGLRRCALRLHLVARIYPIIAHLSNFTIPRRAAALAHTRPLAARHSGLYSVER